jgi:hypothetical protein
MKTQLTRVQKNSNQEPLPDAKGNAAPTHTGTIAAGRVFGRAARIQDFMQIFAPSPVLNS